MEFEAAKQFRGNIVNSYFPVNPQYYTFFKIGLKEIKDKK